jgi:uncharacterized RDD family membrane protein YckC
MRYVGVGRRFLAVVVDGVISIIWTYPFLDIDRSPGYYHAQMRAGGFVGSFAIGLVYYTAMEGLFGATVGKFATGIRVVREDGTKLEIGAALIRNILRLVDALPYVIPYLLGAILVWTSPKKQRLGDRAAKTVVIEASSVGAAPGPGGLPGAGTWTPSPMAPEGITPPPMPPPPPVPAGTTVPDPLPPPAPKPAPEPVRDISPPPDERQS